MTDQPINTKEGLARVMHTTPESIKHWTELNDGQKASVLEQWPGCSVLHLVFQVRPDDDLIVQARFIGLNMQGADLIFQASEFAETFEVEDHEFDGETGAHIYFDEVGNRVEVRSDGSVVKILSEDL